MTYEEWLKTVPTDFVDDPLWRVEVYRLAVFAGELAWSDASKLAANRHTLSLSDQLLRAVGSVSANIAEGYSRSSGKDQARMYEYALGSAREARGWYYQGRPVLTEVVAQHRIQLHTRLIRQLLTIIPDKRGRRIGEPEGTYTVSPEEPHDEVPMP
jgi:four helix bundle protein